MAADHLGRLGLGGAVTTLRGVPAVLVDGLLEDVVPDDVEQVAGPEDDRGQPLLERGRLLGAEQPPAAQLTAQLLHPVVPRPRRIAVVRADAAPQRIVLLGRGVRPERGMCSVGGDQQLRRGEQVRYAARGAGAVPGVVVQRPSGIGAQVADGLAQRVAYVR
ncbi:hypothetical protein GCM10010307_34540 [Streptomyces vastus]|uniref:Uncharacterized protein n=1 Tax=Streptomyces vastus TaxID=285451 RepID=A0ABN3QXC1_9ACTN